MSTRVLANPQFLKIWGNQILLQVAFNMCNFTALLLLDKVTDSRFALAQFYVAMTLPAFIVGIFAGSVVDMTNRKKLMLITDAALSVLFLGYAVFSGNYWAILAIAFSSASIAQFFTPAEAATIPTLVKPKDLEHANALFLFTGLGSVMAGYALSGPVIQLFGGLENNGAEAAFVLGGILTAIGFFLRLSLNSIETVKPRRLDTMFVMRALKLTQEMVDEIKQNKRITLSIGLLTLVEFNVGMLAILFLDFVKLHLNLPTTSISYFLVFPLIAGLAIGIAVLGYVERVVVRGHSIFLACLAFGVVILGLGLAGQLIDDVVILRGLTLFGAVIIGICAVFIAVHARTILQENTRPDMLGRVFSLVTIAASAITPVPILLVALLTNQLEIATIFIFFGVGLVIIAALIGPALYRHLSYRKHSVVSQLSQ